MKTEDENHSVGLNAGRNCMNNSEKEATSTHTRALSYRDTPPPPAPSTHACALSYRRPCAPCIFKVHQMYTMTSKQLKAPGSGTNTTLVFRFRIKGYILSYCHKWKKHYLELGVVDGEILETHINTEFRVFTTDCVALCSFLGDNAPGLVLLWASREPGMEKP